ncbi:MAG: hypothetical protein EHM72_07660 [Calditrichaeota bacterium]|nr:MAG: hypothetical protein EHM72_07660 [Calditrichota bacterium]
MKGTKEGLQQAVVDSFQIMPAADEGLEVRIFGILPSPAYTLDHVHVKKSGTSIEITPWMQYDPNKIVIMVTIPYQETISIGKVERDMMVKIHDAKQTRSRMIRLHDHQQFESQK